MQFLRPEHDDVVEVGQFHNDVTRQNPLTGRPVEEVIREQSLKALEKYNAAP